MKMKMVVVVIDEGSFAVGLLLDDLGLLEDELALLVLLALLEGLLVLPPDVGLAVAAEHVRHRVQPRDQNPVLNARHDTTNDTTRHDTTRTY